MFAWALISLGMLVMGIHGEVASEAYSKNSFTKFLVNQGPTPLVPNEFILDSLMAQVKQMQAAKGNNDGTTDAGVPEESKVTPAEAPFKLRGTGYTYNVKSRAGVINSGNIVGYYDKRTRRIIDGNLVTRRSGHYMLKEKSMLKNPIQMVVPLYAPGLELIKYRLSSNKQEGGKSTFTQDKNPMQIPINKMNTFDRIILNTIPNEKIDLDGAIIWTSYLGPDFCQGHRAGSKLVNPIDSSKFVVCHAYDSYEIMSCPEGLVFIESIGRCDYSA